MSYNKLNISMNIRLFMQSYQDQDTWYDINELCHQLLPLLPM
uniref:Uncharacterized protein n=1 Tax=Arundo donax TaxID=35708 RepID=A0A0A9AEJ1_ARUDO